MSINSTYLGPVTVVLGRVVFLFCSGFFAPLCHVQFIGSIALVWGGGGGRGDSNGSFTANKTSQCKQPARSITNHNMRFTHFWDSRCMVA